MGTQSRKCSRCGIVRPTTDYYKGRRSDGLNPWCKHCYREWHLERYELKEPVPDRQTCRVCGSSYTPKQRRLTKFCSVYCRNQARIEVTREIRRLRLAGRTCDHCGEVLAEGADVRSRYCTSLCAQRARNARRAPGERAAYNIKRLYGITVEERDALLGKQGGGCAICGTAEPGAKGWAVDHDHSCCKSNRTCGQCLRGILCQRCNMGIGLLNDDPDRLRAAARYVSRERRT